MGAGPPANDHPNLQLRRRRKSGANFPHAEASPSAVGPPLQTNRPIGTSHTPTRLTGRRPPSRTEKPFLGLAQPQDGVAPGAPFLLGLKLGRAGFVALFVFPQRADHLRAIVRTFAEHEDPFELLL